jgi:hypothetical protein
MKILFDIWLRGNSGTLLIILKELQPDFSIDKNSAFTVVEGLHYPDDIFIK